MHFSQSKDIKDAITKAKHILINVHRSPDLDSVGSALAFYHVLKKMGKKVTLVGPHHIDPKHSFIPASQNIKKIDFKTFDFSPFDLFLILDSGSSQIVTDSPTAPLPQLPRIVIDHHKTNNIKGEIRLVKDDASATAEILFCLFQDWNVSITPDIATMLFAGLSHDTLFFKYTENDVETFATASSLIKMGADKDLILDRVFNNTDALLLRNVGQVLQKLKIQKSFAWIAVSYGEYKKMGAPLGIREYLADFFIATIAHTSFGVVMLEEKPGKLCISFRGKKGIDVSEIAKKLDGGGHLYRAGATVYGDFKTMVKRVLTCASSPTA